MIKNFDRESNEFSRTTTQTSTLDNNAGIIAESGSKGYCEIEMLKVIEEYLRKLGIENSSVQTTQTIEKKRRCTMPKLP